MGIKAYKPTSPGRRGMVVSDFSELTRRTSEKSLTVGKHSTGGRNNYGRMTVRFRGGGALYNARDFPKSSLSNMLTAKSFSAFVIPQNQFLWFFRF